MNTRKALWLLGFLLCPELVFGLATESIGPSPPVVNQPGWPDGIVDVANHPARVYANWVNGNEAFYFKASPAEQNELLEMFSKCRMRDREVWIKSGAPAIKSFNQQPFEYSASLQVLSGIALHARRRTDASETLEPTLTLYVGEGLSALKQLKIPANLIVHCAVPGADIPPGVKPVRQSWHGRVVFSDGRPATDFEHGITTRVTLWDRAFTNGIELATLDREGFFSVHLSQDELAGLKEGRTWLTAKAGNHLSKAHRQDAKYPAESLALQKAQAKALRIDLPKSYFGRLLFEDNAPAVLQKKPWPGAEIHVDFPYAGPASIDAQGYFQVVLEPEQFEALKARKPSKNIYVPTDSQGHSVAKAVFPPELLSTDKDHAGVVKIPKPALED